MSKSGFCMDSGLLNPSGELGIRLPGAMSILPVLGAGFMKTTFREKKMAAFITPLGETLDRGSAICSKWLYVVALISTAIMAFPTTFDVVSRLAFGISIEGVIEIEELLLVFLTFGTLAFIQSQRGHIIVDMLVARMPARLRVLTDIFNSTLGTGLFAVMTYCMGRNMLDKFSGNEVTFVFNIPLGYAVAFATIGTAVLSVSYLAELLIKIGDAVDNRDAILAALVIILALCFIYSPWFVKDLPIAQNRLLIGGLGMLMMLGLLMIGLPIGVGMAILGALGMIIVYPNFRPAMTMLGIGPYTTASTYLFTVAPMFILMGELALYSGISGDLFKAASTWMGRLPGGLAVASVTGCAGFAAVCGDSMATAVTMASVSLPEMRKKKYDLGLSCACLAAGGTLGILIPPSVGFIFYSLVTEVSVGKLFVAGIIPGILLALIFIFTVVFIAKRNPSMAPPGESSTFKEKIAATKGIFAMLILIVVILGGILTGVFSPNEGGAVGAVGTLIYALGRRRLDYAKAKSAVESATLITAKLVFILIGVGIMGYFFAATRLPFMLSEVITSLDVNRYVIFVAIVIFYIIMGCIMNVIPMILLTLPALFPTIEALQFDPVWFGVVTVILMEMGQITPPVGINVFALSSIATDVPMMHIFRNVVPFFLGMLLLVFVITVFPGIATWLPSVLM